MEQEKIFILIAESIDFAGKIFFEVRKCLQCGLIFFALDFSERTFFHFKNYLSSYKLQTKN